MENKISKIILKYALQNAINYNGKADGKAVAGKVFSEVINVDKKKLLKEIDEVVKKVNSLKLDEQKDELGKIDSSLLEKKKIIEKAKLPELPNSNKGVSMRFAPNPNGPMSLGHSRPALLNWYYVKKYKGKYLLRFDDTDPKIKVPMKEAYDWFIEDLRWLGIKFDKIVYQSNRLEIYYKYGEKLIEMNKAYVCTCDKDVKKELTMKKKSCECRDLDVKEQMKRWKKMLDKDGYKKGEAVLRIKTEINAKNPAVRDWIGFRIVDKGKHPLKKAKVWPLLNFASAIDDYEFKITHIIRGVDLKASDDRQAYIYKYFNWQYPVVMLNGKLLVKGSKSTSQTNLLIKEGEFEGWDDIRVNSIRNLKRRGFQKEGIEKFILDNGLSKRDINVSVEHLNTLNRHILDPICNRYFFVENPRVVKIENSPKLKITLSIHPEKPKDKSRVFETSDGFYVMDDFEKGKVYRFMGLFNFKDNKFLSRDLNLELNAKLIHWLPYSNRLIKAEVVMPDGSVKKGLLEENAKNLKVGDIVQLVRFGFCRLDSKKDVYRFYYGHD